jgi:hypothetical protein
MKRSSSRIDDASRPLTDDSDGEDNAFLADVTAAEDVEKKAFEALHSRRNWLAFFILGTINNLGCVALLWLPFRSTCMCGYPKCGSLSAWMPALPSRCWC